MTAIVRLVLLQGGAYIALLLIGGVVTPAEFGVYGITYGAVMLAMRVVLGGFQPLLAREPGRLEPAVLGAATRTLVIAATLIAACVALAAIAFPGQAMLLLACALFIASVPLRLPALILLSRAVRVGRIAWIQAVDALGFQVIVLGVVWFGGSMETALTAALLSVAIVGPLVCRLLAPWPPLLRSRAPGVTRASVPYLGYSALFNVRELGLLPLVGLLAGTVVAGEFTWAWAIAIVPQIVTIAVVEILYSPLSYLTSSRERFDEAALFVIRMALAVSCIVAAIISACLQLFLVSVANSQWEGTEALTWLLIGATVVSAMEFAIGTIAMAEGRVVAVTKVRGIEIALTVIVAIPTLAFAGSAVAFAAGLFAVRVVAAVGLWHTASNAWFARIARPTAATVASCIAAGLAGAYLGAAFLGWGPGLLVVVGAVTLGLCLVIVRVLDGGTLRADLGTVLRLARGGGAPMTS